MSKDEKEIKSPSAEYGSKDIQHWDWNVHLRKRPGMYLGKLGDGSEKDDGIYVLFKEIKQKYHLKVEHFSTHSMRKTFGRKVYESAGTDAAMALMKLSELFNHSSPKITKIYLGIRQEELLQTYDMLTF